MTSTCRTNTSCLLTNSTKTSSFLALSGSFWYLSSPLPPPFFSLPSLTSFVSLTMCQNNVDCTQSLNDILPDLTPRDCALRRPRRSSTIRASVDRVSPHRLTPSTAGSQQQDDDAITASQGCPRAAVSAACGGNEIRLETTHALACFTSANRAVLGAEWVCSLGSVLCTPRLGGRGG